ncbi:unnamed protein product [Schistocephalus solidus]|uniref:Uncharacterized protein n=1 Tax=Schistocephalus solidus TaxID=70667 RepID=A0A183SZ96_SCHSO|nr:unnamed protein product [Schistocephalus solidus]
MLNGRLDHPQATSIAVKSRAPSPHSSSPLWHSLLRPSVHTRNASRERDAPQNGFPSAEHQRFSPNQLAHRPSTAIHLNDRNGPVTSDKSLHTLRNGINNGTEINGNIASRDAPRRIREGAQKSNSGGAFWLSSSDQGAWAKHGRALTQLSSVYFSLVLMEADRPTEETTSTVVR